MPIFRSLKQRDKKSKKSKPMTQVITDDRLITFRSELEAFDWKETFSDLHDNSAYETFLTAFKAMYEKNFPFREHPRHPSKIRKPWIIRDLFSKIKTKQKLYSKFISTRDPKDLSDFKKFRNKLNSELRKARTQYNLDSLQSCQNDTRKIWKTLNTLLNRSTTELSIEKIIKDGVDVPANLVPDAFNDHFTQATDTIVNIDACDYISHTCNSTIFLAPTTETEVINVFSALKNVITCDR